MTQSEKLADDPLDGYRPSHDEYQQLEEELRAFRSLATDEVQLDQLRSVILRDELKQELKDASSPLRRLVSHAANVYETAQSEWVAEDQANSDKARAAHANARAARLVIDWLATILEQGDQAQRELEVEANE